jgi:hypothetical protein
MTSVSSQHFLILRNVTGAPRAFHNFLDTAGALGTTTFPWQLPILQIHRIIRVYNNGRLRGHYRRPLRLHGQHEEGETASCFVSYSTQSVLYMETELLKRRSQLQPEKLFNSHLRALFRQYPLLETLENINKTDEMEKRERHK